MELSLYRCFKSDQRISMEIYADGVEKALIANQLEPNSIFPSSSLEKWRDNAWVMRYLRYVDYPRQIKKKRTNNENQIHHIIDHGYAHLYPSLSGGKTCISVHDLIPFLTWKGVIKKDSTGDPFSVRKPSFNLYSINFIKKFDRVITISQNTANDLQHYLNIDPEKISIIPPVLDDRFCSVKPSKVAALRKKYQLDENCKWLMVSGREYYKNHHTSLQVLQHLLKETGLPIKLIKTGHYSIEFDYLVKKYDLQKHVKQCFLEDENELPALYNLIDCLLFPSIYEGFGMPVIEALACGTPVIISNKASLPEVGSKFAVQHDCFDVKAISESLATILKDQTFNEMYGQITDWCKQFRAPTIGASLCAAYDSI